MVVRSIHVKFTLINFFAWSICNNFQNHPDALQRYPEAILVAKDEYALDFLGLANEHSEHQLERAIVKNIEVFLREVGTSISFLGSQYRIEIEGKEFFIDLLF